jgi:hypothetical protein
MDTSNRKSRQATIIGTIAGSLSGICLLALAVLIALRRRRIRHYSINEMKRRTSLEGPYNPLVPVPLYHFHRDTRGDVNNWQPRPLASRSTGGKKRTGKIGAGVRGILTPIATSQPERSRNVSRKATLRSTSLNARPNANVSVQDISRNIILSMERRIQNEARSGVNGASNHSPNQGPDTVNQAQSNQGQEQISAFENAIAGAIIREWRRIRANDRADEREREGIEDESHAYAPPPQYEERVGL